jgi:DNA-binding transcriptional MerR regulator
VIGEDPGLPIGQVAARAGVRVPAVRYYERRGLLPPPARRHSGHRVYETGVVDLLRTVKQAQRVGFTLAQITELLRLSGSRGQAALRERVRAKLADIDARIRDLQQMRSALEAALHADCTSLTHCTDQDCPFWIEPPGSSHWTP